MLCSNRDSLVEWRVGHYTTLLQIIVIIVRVTIINIVVVAIITLSLFCFRISINILEFLGMSTKAQKKNFMRGKYMYTVANKVWILCLI